MVAKKTNVEDGVLLRSTGGKREDMLANFHQGIQGSLETSYKWVLVCPLTYFSSWPIACSLLSDPRPLCW